jgi:tRNA (adenine22-N1)-methyltransferase
MCTADGFAVPAVLAACKLIQGRNMNNIPKISKRLEAAASFVRRDARIADIGTDHAYLPIYLCNLGKIRGALASDINEGPVARAKINIASYHLGKKISVLRTDGLSGVESFSPDDIVICGMGGELICSIIDAAEWTKNKKIRLILQPMTHAEKLRAYLISNGFSIVGETILKEDKIYQIICAEYTGETTEYSEIEAIFGKISIKQRTDVFEEYLSYVRGVFETRRNGKALSGADVSAEEAIIEEIDKLSDKGRKY